MFHNTRKNKGRDDREISLHFVRLQIVIGVLIVVGAVILTMQHNVTYRHREASLNMVQAEQFSPAVNANTECLMVYSLDPTGMQSLELMEPVLRDMRVKADFVQVSDFDAKTLSDYNTLVVGVSELRGFGDQLLEIRHWVQDGGRVMFSFIPTYDGAMQFIHGFFGITGCQGHYRRVESLHFNIPFMLGAAEKDYNITDAFDSGLEIALDADCTVYAQSQDGLPIIWTRSENAGTVLVSNLNILDKNIRGFYAAMYSLLEPAFAYPVINGSAFYIDDFPSPVPGGYAEKIEEDFGMSIGDFYTQVWWRDVENLSKQYGIRYTGLVIEQYSDDVKAPFPRNTDSVRFKYFGNQLLRDGGELGFHGYNHMPLVLPNFDYQKQYPSYKQWYSLDDMRAGVAELYRFCKELFPKEEFQTYIPPSNILSQEGRQMLAEDFPNVKAIASVYLPGDLAYEQEFTVDEWGVVQTPRIISGYILDDYIQMSALGELNMHYVNTHFQHPDDVLDMDRGADLGWRELYSRLCRYVQWLFKTAPDIRSLTGIELAAAVQRYDALSVRRELTPGSLKLQLGGFADEAWLFVRINEGKPGQVTGGELTELIPGLYLLKAKSDTITVALQ